MASPETRGNTITGVGQTHHRDRQPTNPYRSPAGVEDEPSPLPDAGSLRSRDLKCIAQGIALAHLAAILTSLSLLVPACIALIAHEGMLFAAARAFPIRPALALPGVFVIAIGVGAHWCNRVRGKHQSLCWLATLLFLVGGLGTLVSLVRLVGGGNLLGLSVFFAASTFSAFLTGTSLFALFFRVWSTRCGSKRASLFFEGTVLCLAIAGVVTSAAVLWPSL